jgi:hypothetical protein
VKNNISQVNLFGESQHRFFLPTGYEPTCPNYFTVSQIYLARDSVSTPERRQFVERICRLYPEATVVGCLDVPHNRIGLNETDVERYLREQVVKLFEVKPKKSIKKG